MIGDAGYVRLHRTLIGHAAFRNDGEAMAFAWMVLRAAWRPTTVRYKGKAITLERGQLAVSVRDMATHLGQPKGWAERLLAKLRKQDMVRTDVGQGVMVLTICKYEVFQNQSDDTKTRGRTTPGTGAGQRQDTEQEREKGKKEKKSAIALSPGEAGDALPLFEAEPGLPADPPEPEVSYSASFTAFYEAFPRREGKADAARAYDDTIAKLMKGRPEGSRPRAHAKLLAASTAFAVLSKGGEKRFIKAPGPWLRAGRYDDDAIKQYLERQRSGTLAPGEAPVDWKNLGRQQR